MKKEEEDMKEAELEKIEECGEEREEADGCLLSQPGKTPWVYNTCICSVSDLILLSLVIRWRDASPLPLWRVFYSLRYNCSSMIVHVCSFMDFSCERRCIKS